MICRYDRQRPISGWHQALGAPARVLVVGAGALWNEGVENLALLGMGHLPGAQSGELIRGTNFSRCVLFRQADEGTPKAEAATAAIRAVKPDIDVHGEVPDVRRLGPRLLSGLTWSSGRSTAPKLDAESISGSVASSHYAGRWSDRRHQRLERRARLRPHGSVSE